MDWFVGLSLLVVGAIIGFFVAKYVNNQQGNKSDQVTNEQTVKELMTQQASTHVQQSREIAEQLMRQAEAIKQQINNYEQLLISQSEGTQGSSLNYFGEHTSTFLRHKEKTPTRSQSNADIQPLDFSSQGSGLFSGSEETAVKETK